MKNGVIRAFGRPVHHFDIAPDHAALRETAQNPTGPHGTGRPRMNLRQCPICLSWNPLAFVDCPRCPK